MPRLPAIVFMLAAVLCAGPAAASGYFVNGAGSNSRALSGAGVALATDTMAIANNPASGVALEGRQFQIGSTFLHPRPKLLIGDLPEGSPPPGSQPLPPGIYESKPDVPLQYGGTFAIPHAAFNWRLNKQWAVGISTYGNGGLNSTFEDVENNFCPPESRRAGILCGGTLSSDIAQTFIAPSVSWQPLDWLRVGFSALGVWQALEVRGFELLAPQSSDPDNFSNNGHDHALGYGAKAGAQIRVLPGVSLGLVAQTKIEMDEFDDYAGLLPEQGTLEIPPYFQVGLAWDFLRGWTVVADFQKIYYDAVAATGNTGDPAKAGGPFGTDEGPGFGWNDAEFFKFGLIHRLNDRWTLRAGYADSNALFERDDVFYNFISGSILEERFNIGTTYQLDENNSIDFAVHYFPDQTLTTPNPTLPGQEITLSLGGISGDLSWQHRF